MIEKTCTKCGEMKSIDEFHKHKKYKDGLQTWCKDCVKQYQKQYQKANKDQILEQKKHYYEAHRDRACEYQKQYYQANRDHILEQKKQYQRANKDRACEYQKQYYQANRDHILEYQKHYKQANRDAYNVRNAKRRALKLKQTPDLTTQEQDMIKLYYKLSRAMGKNYHVDHIIPLAKGGLHHPDNLQILTTEDNFSKHDRINYDYKHPRFKVVNNQLTKVV